MKAKFLSFGKMSFSLLMALLFLFTLSFQFVSCSSDDDDSNDSVTTTKTDTEKNDNNNNNGETTDTSKKNENDNNNNGDTTDSTKKSDDTETSTNSGKMFMSFDNVANFDSGATADEITTKILSLTSDTTIKLNGAINAVTLKKIVEAMKENDSIQIALDLSDTSGIVEWKDWFAEVTTLYSISLPKAVTTIQSGAFKDCTKLQAVTIPCTIQSCSSVKDFYSVKVNFSGSIVDWLKSPVDFGNYTFYLNGAELSGALSIPNSVTSIKNNAFYGCSKLTSVTIPSSVTSIGNAVFNGCSSLENVVMEDGDATLTVGYNTYASSGAGKSLFYDCPLKKLYLGRNLSYSADSKTGYSPFYEKATLTFVEIGGKVTSISNGVFSGCTSLTEVTISQGDTTLEFENNTSFSDCPLEKLCLYRELSYPTDSGTGYSPFYDKATINSVEIGGTMTNISYNMFGNCSKLTSITIDESVTNIKRQAFYNCSDLTKVYYKGTLTQWLGISFASGYFLYNDYSNPCCNGAELYINGEKIINLTIPDGITTIKNAAFNGCKGLKSVIIPSSVTSIGEDAFFNCDGVTKVYYNGTPAQWLGIKFDGYYSNPCCNIAELYINGELVTNLTIPEEITSIGEAAFKGVKSLTSVTIHSSVTSIGQYAFCSSKLTSVIIPDSVTSIGNSAFYYCNNLASVTISKNITSIGDSMFSGSKLSSVTIPDNVTSIANYAFNQCSELTSVTIGDKMAKIGLYAFSRCNKISTVNYRGTSSQWEAIDFTSGNDLLKNATKVYNYTEE